MPQRISARNGVQPGKSTRRRIRSGQMVPEGRAFGRGQRRGVHPVGREKQCGAQVIRFPDEGGIFMTEVTPWTERGSEFLDVGGSFFQKAAGRSGSGGSGAAWGPGGRALQGRVLKYKRRTTKPQFLR